jgi:trimeric autotransporter adhesin
MPLSLKSIACHRVAIAIATTATLVETLLGCGLSAPLHAQTPPPPAAPAPPSVGRLSAANLKVLPRLGIGHTSSGGGFDGFTRFEGFVPLHQVPGQDLLFLETKFLLDNEANAGGNLLLGYRALSPTGKHLWGGYLAFDHRDTGNHSFSQLGLGVEHLGTWDFRANAYLPLGDRRHILSEQSLNGPTSQFTDLRFQGNFLLTTGQRQTQSIRQLEAALGGFDLEAGTKLASLGKTGDLRGYGGLYYYDAPGSDGTLGWRVRLAARPTDTLALGMALQDDGRFGTVFQINLGLTFPGSRPQGAAPDSLLARLGESTARTGTVVVDRQTEVVTQNQAFADAPLLNATTGQPYLFQHLAPGTTGGNGTVESPFGQMQLALNATRPDGNSIVYVQGNNAVIPAFTIPAGVQVLSSGPVQTLASLDRGIVQIPNSGGGVFPAIAGTVTLNDNTVLSGFTIASPTGPAVTGTGIGTTTIRQNRITSAQDQGISLRNLTAGTITITDNTISTVQGGNTLDAPITIPGLGSDITIPTPLGNITVAIPAAIPLPTGQGIVVTGSPGPVNILRNAIANTTSQGIVILSPSGTVNLQDNSIRNTVGTPAPVAVLGSTVLVPAGQGIIIANASGPLNLNRNTLDTLNGQGIAIAGSTAPTTIDFSTINRASDQGILLIGIGGAVDVNTNSITNTASRTTNVPVPILGTVPVYTGQGLAIVGVTGNASSFTIRNNTIAGTEGVTSTLPIPPSSGQGVLVAITNGQTRFTFTNNQVRNSFDDGMLFGFIGTSQTSLTINGNTIEGNGGIPVRGDGIALALEGSAVLNDLLIENNIIRNNGDEGIDIRLGILTFAPSTAQVTGTIRNNTITGNAQNGIQLQTFDTTQANLTMTGNTLTSNGFRGIDLSTFDTSRLSTDIRLNTFTGNATPGLQTVSFANTSTLCVNLTGNTSTTGYQLGTGTQVVNLPGVTTANTGTVTAPGTVNVLICP